MKKKVALMVVAGGRGVPDALALLYLKPALVLPITSKEGWDTEKAFLDLAHRIPGCTVLPMMHVDAYDLDKAIEVCREELNACREKFRESDPDVEWEWIFTITSAPKILAFAAYEIAKDLEVPCWFSASLQEKVVSLIKEYKVDTERFFHLSFNDYIKIQGRTCRKKEPQIPRYRETVEAWADVAEKLALSSETYQLSPIFYSHMKRKDKNLGDAVRDPMCLPSNIEDLSLVKWLVKRGMLKIGKACEGGTLYRFNSKEAAHFLGTGDWLEVYVWDQINKVDDKPFADDCRWGYEIPKNTVKNELDIALMYKAQLVVAECKTDEQPFEGKKNYLQKIDAVADQLGGDYVSKVFVTNQPGKGESYNIFCKQADQRNIKVVTRESLHEIGKIMKKQAIYPTFPRK